VVGIDPATTASPEGGLGRDATVLTNSFGVRAWSGPCPPLTATHVYRFTVHALAEPLDGELAGSPDDLLAAIGSLEITRAEITGTFGR